MPYKVLIMLLKAFVLFGYLCLSEQATVTNSATDDVRRLLFDKIRWSMKKSGEPCLRPAGKNVSTPTEVKLILNIVQLLSFDEETGVIETLAWLAQSWKDRNIKWSPSKFGGIKHLNIPSEYKIWKPDIALYNSRTGKTDFDRSLRVHISYDGTVMWVPPIKMETDCDLRNDTWVCEWKFGSWTYTGNELSLHPSPTVDLNSFRPSRHGWKILAAKAKTHTKHYACCPEPYQDVVFEVSLKKKD